MLPKSKQLNEICISMYTKFIIINLKCFFITIYILIVFKDYN